MKRVLVTGASSGIGLATAKMLLAQGDEVVGIARNFSKTDLSELGGTDMQKVELDLSDLGGVRNALSNNGILNQSFDTLVLNAGYGRFGSLEQFSHKQIEHLINTNLVSNLFLIKHYSPVFKTEGDKDIVIVGSESALQGGKQGTVYCASKFALRGMAQSLRADFTASNSRVMMVNPGPVDTDFFDELSFQPQVGEAFTLSAQSIAQSIVHALSQPRHSVIEEINIQPMKRSFEKKS